MLVRKQGKVWDANCLNKKAEEMYQADTYLKLSEKYIGLGCQRFDLPSQPTSDKTGAP
jgi:hypothetical protein